MFISGYGPGSGKSEEEMEGFWNVLNNVAGVLVGMSRW